MTTLQDLMISRVRVKILNLFFSQVETMYYVRQITREIREEINAVRRELERMVGFSLIKSEQRGNRVYYYLNKNYPLFGELQQMVIKTTGLGLKLRKFRRKLGQIQFVMFSSKFVSGSQPAQGEVDILVIGEVVLQELEQLIKETQAEKGREINYAVFTTQEFEFRKTRRDPFVMDVLYGGRVMVIGSEEEFVNRQLLTRA
ncbi:MAG: hypothetical protein ABIJ03_04330 [Patescibacteria group bacterium]|nr:hypothetical protein [Patescibacteria group bacterium]